MNYVALVVVIFASVYLVTKQETWYDCIFVAMLGATAAGEAVRIQF